MLDSTRRAIRTGLDAVLAVLVSIGAVLLVPGFNETLDRMTAPGASATIGVLVLALTVFFTKLRNTLEDSAKIPALLKAPASDGADPVPNHYGSRGGRGAVQLGLVSAVILAALVALLLVIIL